MTAWPGVSGSIPMVLGQEVARLNKVVQQVHKGNQAADFDTFGKGAWTFELIAYRRGGCRVDAVAYGRRSLARLNRHGLHNTRRQRLRNRCQ